MHKPPIGDPRHRPERELPPREPDDAPVEDPRPDPKPVELPPDPDEPSRK